MGVGKTAVCRSLKQKLPNAVFLDGDWCWDADPFTVNDETKRMVIRNICFMLNQFLSCTAYDNVIFCWVMHEQNIIDDILKNTDRANCITLTISLICSSDILAERLGKDIRGGIRNRDVIERSIAKLPLYDKLNIQKIDTTDMSIDDVAETIAAL